MSDIPVVVVLGMLRYPPRSGMTRQTAVILKELERAGLLSEVWACKLKDHQADASMWLLDFQTPLKVIPFDSRRETGIAAAVLLATVFRFVPGWLARIVWPDVAAAGRLVAAVKDATESGKRPLLFGMALAPLFALKGVRGRGLISTIDAQSLRKRREGKEATGLARLRVFAERLVARMMEILFLPSASAVHVHGENDRRYYEQKGLRRTVNIPIYVECGDRGDEYIEDAEEHLKTTDAIVIFGNLDTVFVRKGAYAAARRIMDAFAFGILPTRPIVFLTVGSRYRFADLEGEGVFFHKWVANLEMALRVCHVVILPDTGGSGMRNRVLDVLRAGVPLLASQAALENFAIPEIEQFEYGSEEELIAKLKVIESSDEKRKMLVEKGRRFVCQRNEEIRRQWIDFARN